MTKTLGLLNAELRDFSLEGIVKLKFITPAFQWKCYILNAQHQYVYEMTAHSASVQTMESHRDTLNHLRETLARFPEGGQLKAVYHDLSRQSWTVCPMRTMDI